MTNPNRPRSYNSPTGNIIPDSMLDESFRGEYSAATPNANLIYKGFAKPGADEGQPVWQIAKLAYDAGGNVLSIKWPQLILNPALPFTGANLGAASNDYFFAWSLRGSYTYV